MEKEHIQFEKRASGHGPFVVGSYVPSAKICSDIKVGNHVSLETDGVTVLARITEIEGKNYKGVITSFENYIEESYQGYSRGDDIAFMYDEIHGCF